MIFVTSACQFSLPGYQVIQDGGLFSTLFVCVSNSEVFCGLSWHKKLQNIFLKFQGLLKYLYTECMVLNLWDF